MRKIMAAKNDITQDEIKSRASNDNYLNSPFWENLEKKKRQKKEDKKQKEKQSNEV